MNQTALRASLSKLAAGDIDVRDARVAIRSAVKAGGRLLDDVVTAMRDTAFRIVSSRTPDPELEHWYDLSTHATALLRQAERPDLAERLKAHSELIAQAGRFGERQPVEEVLGRKHVTEVLDALAGTAGALARAQLAERTSLADANLSRVLGILGTHGLIHRRRHGKEAHISLTDAGRLAAARLGYDIKRVSASTADWWRGLAWPVSLWAADGEPVGVNDAFRALAEEIGLATPSMLTHAEWTDALAALAHETRGTDQHGVRDLRLSNDSWFRLIEDRLAGGEHVAMLADISSTMIVRSQLDRQLKQAREQLAAVRADLASVQAELIDNQRRLVSFTSWLDQLKFAVAGETTSLASRLHRWRARVRSPALRAEADDADRHLLSLRNAVQTLLYTATWSKPDEPLQLIDVSALIGGPVEAVRALGAHTIEVDASGFHHLTEVKASVPGVQAAIGQSLYNFVREQQIGFDPLISRCLVRAEYKDKHLRLLFLGQKLSRESARPMRGFDWYAAHAGSDHIVECGLGHAYDVAESIGGTIQVGADQSFVIVNLPVDSSVKRTRIAKRSAET